MSTTTDQQPDASTPEGNVGGGVDIASLVWIDIEDQTWRVELSSERLILNCESDDQEAIDIPAGAWSRDLYISDHGSRFLVRIETFARSVRFFLDVETAAPLLSRCRSKKAAEPDAAAVDESASAAGLVLWPTVSPLAVWALICSAFAFVPILGLLPAIATFVLLAEHRRTVRRTKSWEHSRALCKVASVFCVCGLVVSALAIWSWSQPGSASPEAVADSGVNAGRNWGMIAAAVLVVFFSLSIHEAAHAISALWLGDDLARSLGRVTLNPLSHIDPFGTIALPLILAMAGGPVFGYARPVPVRVESLPRRRRAHILISLAGPGSNMLLAAASLMLLLVLGAVLRLAAPEAVVTNLTSLSGMFDPVTASGFALAPVFASACTILKLSFIINTFLAIFNLIPLPPLDGSWVLEHLFPMTLGRFYAAVRPYGFLLFIGAIYMGLFDYLVIPVFVILLPGLGMVTYVTGF